MADSLGVPSASAATISTTAGAGASHRKGPQSAQEAALLREAKKFEKFEEQKNLTQCLCIGQELPTEEEIAAVLEEREINRKDEEYRRRVRDRNLKQSIKETDRVIVPFEAHPANAAATTITKATPSTTPTPPAPVDLSQVISAAEQVASRGLFLDAFLRCARNTLRTYRVQRRVNLALTALKGEIKKKNFFDENHVPQISVFTFPSMAESPMDSLAPTTKAGEDQAKPPTSMVDDFEPVEIKEPLHFKEMGYTVLPLTVHKFVNVDKEEPLAMFPLGDDEPTVEDLHPLPSALKITDFVPHANSLTNHFPTPNFCFAPSCSTEIFPHDCRQPEDRDEHAGLPQMFSFDLGQRGKLPLATDPRNVMMDMLNAPLPKVKIRGRAEDILSDTDDEEADEVALDDPHPKSFQSVCATFGGFDDHFVFSGTEGDPVDLIEEKPIHQYDQQKTNDVDLKTVADVYERVLNCIPPDKRTPY